MNERLGRDPGEVALFVFIPFCKIKCTYCDFNAYANMARLMDPYVRAVVREIRSRAEAAGRLRACSIYLGGGTPSLVPAQHILDVLAACREGFDLASGAEITVEANPGTVDYGKLKALYSAGVNRLSLGVQSFDDPTLRRFNRGHTVADARDTYRLARQAGFDNINLDLMYGLPLQTMPDWQASVECALELQPEHLSLYALTVEGHTGLAFQLARGKYPRPDDDLAAEMYSYAGQRLEEAGYFHYEISNWCRLDGQSKAAGQEPGKRDEVPLHRESTVGTWTQSEPGHSEIPVLASRHNLTYWRNDPYLGFGAGAHSSSGGERYWNVLLPSEYIERIEKGASVVAGRETISRPVKIAESVILGLRLIPGISLQELSDRFGEDLEAKYGEEVKELKGLGLLEQAGMNLRLTPRGRLLSNEVFWRFLPD